MTVTKEEIRAAKKRLRHLTESHGVMLTKAESRVLTAEMIENLHGLGHDGSEDTDHEHCGICGGPMSADSIADMNQDPPQVLRDVEVGLVHAHHYDDIPDEDYFVILP